MQIFYCAKHELCCVDEIRGVCTRKKTGFWLFQIFWIKDFVLYLYISAICFTFQKWLP